MIDPSNAGGVFGPFAAGDVVCLRSGGEEMTALSVSEDGIQCVWMHKGVLKQETLPHHALRKGKPVPMIVFSDVQFPALEQGSDSA
jgi:uncharacterized protein YodC (DUF2158 family)